MIPFHYLVSTCYPKNYEEKGTLVMWFLLVDHKQRQEREVMLKLKQVVDKQRDELRAKGQEITTISKEVEAVRI